MLSISPKSRIYLSVEPIDFRKGMDALVRYCQHMLSISPFDGQYFVFCNRRKSDVKILYYDGQGFCLLHKRLSVGRFIHWPSASDSTIYLTPIQLQVLFANGNPANTDVQPNWR